MLQQEKKKDETACVNEGSAMKCTFTGTPTLREPRHRNVQWVFLDNFAPNKIKFALTQPNLSLT